MDDYYEYFVSKGNHPQQTDILKQEKEFTFHSFSHYDAYLLAKLLIENAYQNNRNIGVRIVLHNKLVFQYIMDNLDVDNSVNWLLRKEKVCHMTQHSSYYAFLENIVSHQYDDYIHNQEYAVCGGSFPVLLKDEFIGSITVTGGRPHEDHQMIIDCLKERKIDDGK